MSMPQKLGSVAILLSLVLSYPFLMMDYYARGILKGLDIKQIWEEEREDEEEEENEEENNDLEEEADVSQNGTRTILP